MSKQDIHIRLGNRIRKLRREQNNLTQEKLAQKAGISLYYVQLLEARNPSRSPTLNVLEKLADAFEMPVWKFLKFED